MFDKNSRYYSIEGATIQVRGENGGSATVVYKKRRFIPGGENMTAITEHPVAEGERLDNITARYLGDPTQFWRLCDSNLILNPEELMDIGRKIKIAMPYP